MSITLITAPEAEPISLAEAKAQCSVDSSDWDTLLTLYIQAARQKAEGELQRALITQTWEQRLDAFPDAEVMLEKPGVLSIVSVKYLDTSGVEQTLAPSAYALDAAASPGWLYPADGTTWPTTDDVINAVRIQYTAGFGPAAADVPAPIRAWMLLTIGYLFAQREAIDATGKAAAIPSRFVDSLLDPWRVYGL